MHDIRFPNESDAYRGARNALLADEIALRRDTEALAERRRALPPGGEIPQDYEFDESEADGNAVRARRLSSLFVAPHDTLVMYGFMYGPDAARPCPMCTSILDSLDGAAVHLGQRVNLCVVAKSPIARIQAFARERGWRNLHLLSSGRGTFNSDYHAEDSDGAQLPSLNVFVRRDGRIRHFWNSEMLFAGGDPGQDSRHVDAIWPLWNVLDLTPAGRGSFHPRLAYRGVALPVNGRQSGT